MDEMQHPDIEVFVRESCTVKEIVRRLQDDKGLSLTDSQIRYVSELVDSVLIEKITAEEDARLARELQQEELKRTSRVRPSRTGRPQTKQRSPQTKPTKIHRNARSKGASASRVSGFNKPPAVVKKIWEYVKSNDLQDPSNKRIIICDEKLEAVFRRKRVDCFQMNKYLVDHLAAEDEAMETSGHEDVKSHRSIDDVKSHRSSEDVKVPSQLKTMLPQLPTKASSRAIQEGCLEYIKNQNLFDPNNPTIILVNDTIRQSLQIGSDTKLTLFDFVDRIQSILNNDDLH